MRRRIVALAVCACLCVALWPTPVPAGGRSLPPRGLGRHALPGGVKAAPVFRPKSAFGSPGGFPLPIGADRHHHGVHRLPRHALVPRFPSTVFFYTPAALYGPPAETPAPVVTVSPVVHASPTIYVSPTVVVPERVPVAAAPSVEPLPPLSPMPNVVEHPTGRYELRGDGMTSPYTWVWIPNPPSGPPDAPGPSSGDPAAGQAPSANRSRTYQWTDDEGTAFWTNRPETIPKAYRSRARGASEVATP